jgi:siderophore synthetase component
VPSQAPRPAPATGDPDPLEHPDAYTAADASGAENLLRCWVRETGLTRPEDGALSVSLPQSGTVLVVPVRYWSPGGHHRFGAPALVSALDAPVDAVTLAALLARESAARDAGTPRATRDGADFVARVADSVRRTAAFLTVRRIEPDPGPGENGDRFLDAEQALLLGHPLHPTPKSREGLSEAEARGYSPELRGSYRLHWMAVDRSLLATDSAWTERGRRVPAEQLLARLAGPGLHLPKGTAALPLHPWQAREVRPRF